MDYGYESVNYTDTFNPTVAGVQFDALYYRISPTKTTPLIILMDEVDDIIRMVHDGKVLVNQNVPTQITKKSEWNGFLDKFDRDVYPYVILVLTMNSNKETIDALDDSYLRQGRIDIVHHVEKCISL